MNRKIFRDLSLRCLNERHERTTMFQIFFVNLRYEIEWKGERKIVYPSDHRPIIMDFCII
jgi:hypothetical protein